MANRLQLVIILLRKQSYWIFSTWKQNVDKVFSDDAKILKLYFTIVLLLILLFLLL